MDLSTTAEREIVCDDALLDPDGRLRHVGWSRGPRLHYQPGHVRAARQRIKEWEHYTVLTPDAAISLTLAQLGVVGVTHVELLDLRTGHVHSGMDLFLPSRDGLPPSPLPAAHFAKRTRRTCFEIGPERRAVSFRFGTRGVLAGKIELTIPTPADGLAVITPFESGGLFFYEWKVPDLQARGWIASGKTRYELDGVSAILDWGRGAWPERSRWLWGWGAGVQDGQRISFNLGCGFGDMTAASENALVLDGTLHKLGRVSWRYDPGRRDTPWHFEDEAGRLSLRFTPRRHHEWQQNLVIWSARLDKVYGHYSGQVVLDDGRTLTITDAAGFAEEMTQRW